MKTHLPLTMLAALAGLLSIAPGIRAAEQVVGATATQPALMKGMTADQVVAIVGQPAEVRPMRSPSGKAEVWVYRRRVARTVQQVPIDGVVSPMYTESNTDHMVTTTPQYQSSYRQEYVDVYQVTSLLMFEGQLVAAKQQREEQRRYE